MDGTERGTCENCRELRSEQVGMLQDRLALKRRIARLKRHRSRLMQIAKALRDGAAEARGGEALTVCACGSVAAPVGE